MSKFECESQLRCTLKCAFNISCFEMEVYTSLLKNPSISVEELAEILKKDKSTVYKALQNLMDKGLVEREYRILRGGGYKYLYKPIPFDRFREEMIKNINEWASRLVEFLDELSRMDEEELIQVL